VISASKLHGWNVEQGANVAIAINFREDQAKTQETWREAPGRSNRQQASLIEAKAALAVWCPLCVCVALQRNACERL
jgi:hypothetical protein